jgi:acetolactate synthase-1/2/3 large subunit
MDQRVTSTAAMSFIRALGRRGIEHVFTNAGTDHAPIVEALCTMRERGETVPQFHVVPHENLAISMAQGYYGVSGKPAGVLLHVTVGTANSICGLMNARRSFVPILLLAGRTPSTQDGHVGSRNVPIHWGQDSFDQGGLVREFTKWDNELRAGQSVDALVDRAISVAMTEPRGPVYLTLPRELLANADEAEAGPISPIASAPQPDPTAIAEVAEALAAAERPVVVTSTLGINTSGRHELERLADRYAIPVLQAWPFCINIASSHAMNLRISGTDWLGEADVVLSVDAAVPWVPRYTKPRSDAQIFVVGSDPTYAMYPYRAFPATRLISGAGFMAMPMLREAIAACRTDAKAIDARREAIAARQTRAAQARSDRIATARRATPIDAAWIAECLNAHRPPGSVIVNELCLPFDYLRLEDGDCFFGETTAGGLGAGLGFGLGAKLADRSRTVISGVGDGSYMFGNPTPALLVGRALDIPTLTIVSNNNLWYAVRQSTLSVYPDGAAAAADPMPLTHFGPSPNYADMAAAAGAWAERVTDPDALPGAFESAFARVADGQAAVLDIVTEPGTR